MATDFADFVPFADLNDVEVQEGGGTFVIPDPGEYTLEIVEAKATQSKAGRPTLEVHYRVASEGENLDRTCRGWYTLDPQAAPFAKGRTKCLLVAAQVPIDKNGFSVMGLKGVHIQATIQHEPYNAQDAEGNTVQRISAKVSNERPIVTQVAAPPAQAKANTKNGPAPQQRR